MIFYSFSELPTVKLTIYKVLYPKRLKIKIIKEQLRKNLKKRKKLDGNNFCESRIFCNFQSKPLRILNLDYALAETFAKTAKKRENRKNYCPRKFQPLSNEKKISPAKSLASLK